MQLANIRINITKVSALFILTLALASCGGGNESRVDGVTNAGGEDVSRVDDITNADGEEVSRVDDITNADGEEVSRVDDITNADGEEVSRVDDITNADGEEVSRVDDITNGGGDGFSRIDSVLNNTGSTSSGSGSPPVLTYLDCSNLDPNKVYVLGTFSLGSALYVLTDIESPNRFCVGFPTTSFVPVISETGSLLYRHEKGEDDYGAMVMNQEPLVTETNETGWNWSYPATPAANDVELFSAAYRSTTMHLRVGAGNDEIYGSGTVVDGEEEFIYLNTNPYYQPETASSFLGVMPNGSLLMRAQSPADSTNLYLVDTDFNVIPLTAPTEAPHHIYQATKAFTNPTTGNQSVWIIASNGDTTNPVESRWSIDLATNTVTDDGVLSAKPENVFAGIDKAISIGGSGEVFQVATYEDASSSYWVVLKRGLESSDVGTEVIYSERGKELEGASWTANSNPFVFILSLVTGP